MSDQRNPWEPPGYVPEPATQPWLTRGRKMIFGGVAALVGVGAIGALADSSDGNGGSGQAPPDATVTTAAPDPTSGTTAPVSTVAAEATIEEVTSTSQQQPTTTAEDETDVDARCTDAETTITVDLGPGADAVSGVFVVTFEKDGDEVGKARSDRVVILPDVKNRFVVPTPRSVTFFTDCVINVQGSRVATRQEVEATPTPTPTSPTTTTTTTSPPTTTTTSPPTTTTVPDDRLLALDVLQFVPIILEQQSGYNRDLFSEGLDADGDGCDTRDEVLLRDSIVRPTKLNGCNDVAGRWRSRYDGVLVDSSGDLQVDHVVSLKEAWDSGAWAWNDQQLADFANDLGDRRALRAVTAESNQQKGDKDPSNWLPTDQSAVCRYVADWVAIKSRWKLAMDESEWGRIKNLLNGQCFGERLGEWRNTLVPIAEIPPPPTAVPPPTTTPPPATPATPAPTSQPQPQQAVYYENCAAAEAAGATPVYRGDPGYAPHLDGDNDGVGCES